MKTSEKKPKLIGQVKKDYPLKPRERGTINDIGRSLGVEEIQLARRDAGHAFSYLSPVENGLLGYSTRCLVQANLPHSEPKTSQFLTRHS